MKNIPLWAGILFLAVGVFLIWNSPRDMGQKLDVGWGSVELPPEWKVESRDADGRYVASSPDYVPADFSHTRVGEGEALNEISAGMQMYISGKLQDAGANMQTPAAYVALTKSLIEPCSNCFDIRTVTFDGVPALYYRSTADDHGGGAAASTVLNSKIVFVSFAFAEYTPETQQIIDHTLASIDLK